MEKNDRACRVLFSCNAMLVWLRLNCPGTQSYCALKANISLQRCFKMKAMVVVALRA